MALHGAELQELLVRLGLDTTPFSKGIAFAESRLIALQHAASETAAAMQALASAKSLQKGQMAQGLLASERTLGRLRESYGSVQSRARLMDAANARFATQESTRLNRMDALRNQAAARYASSIDRAAAWNQTRLANQARLAEKAWATEVAGINAAAAAQLRYNEIAASQTVGARFNKGLTAPTGRLAQIGVAAAGGGLKFLERSFLVTAAAGAVLESQFFKVQDAQAAMARTLEGEALPTLARLNADILTLSRTVPLPITELYRLAEVAGTVGIAGKDIAKFTEIVARLTATTDLTADEASQQLGRLLNIFDLTVDEADNLSSALIKLSVSQASSDQEILTATERFASLGKAMGFTAAQLLAIGSAGTALGQEPEAVGGSIQRIFAIFNKLLGSEKVTSKLKDFAAVSGVTVKQLREDWATNPMLAFEQFLEGFGKLTSQQQAQLFGSGELFPSFVRGQQTLQNLSAQLSTLKTGVADATAEFDRGQLIYEQSAVRFDTLKKNIQLLGNAFVEAGYVFGAGFQDEAGDAIKQLTQYIIESLPAIERFGQQVGRILTGIDWGKAKTYADAFFGTIKKGFDIVASLPPELLALLGAFKAFNFLSGGALGNITGSFASGIGGVIKNSLAALFAGIPILNRAFVQNVFVTNPGFGGAAGGVGGLIGKASIAGLLATLGAFAVAAVVSYGIVALLRPVLEAVIPKEWLAPGGKTQGQEAQERANAASRVPQPAGGYPFLALEAAKEQMRVARYMADASKDDAVTAEQLSAASSNLLAATKKWLDALKPRHREGEKGKSIQSAEFAALDRLNQTAPNYLAKMTAYVQDLVDHYTKQPVGTKGHSRAFSGKALTGAARDLAGDLRRAVKDGNEDQKTALVQALKDLDRLPNFKLPPGIRKLIQRVEESKETQKETKTATRKVVGGLERNLDKLQDLRATLQRKKLSVSVRQSAIRVDPAKVVVGGTLVRVGVGARSFATATQRTVAYGPALVYGGNSAFVIR